jgi:3' terminal RNA ribose 2'-O-methyltransferase Hen1
VTAVPCRDGVDLLHALFGPLGWRAEASTAPLDPAIPEWGDSGYLDVRLTGQLRLADALNHLYVLLPVLDDAKHYWVSDDEVGKLIRAGEGWLAAHPEKALITRRYLAHQRELTRSALARLAEIDDAGPGQFDDPPDGGAAPDPPGQPAPLAGQRRAAVLAALRAAGARRVADLGCGEGALVADLLAERGIERVVATDVSARALHAAGRRLRLEMMPDQQRDRLQIFQSALTYRDDRLAGLDAAVLMEVIEHVDLPRLPAVERVVFGDAVPRVVIVTTPNAEYNVRYEGLTGHRHPDHRFEWTRAQFGEWTARVAGAYGYRVRHIPVGDEDPEVGAPTQMGVFVR